MDTKCILVRQPRDLRVFGFKTREEGSSSIAFENFLYVLSQFGTLFDHHQARRARIPKSDHRNGKNHLCSPSVGKSPTHESRTRLSRSPIIACARMLRTKMVEGRCIRTKRWYVPQVSPVHWQLRYEKKEAEISLGVHIRSYDSQCRDIHHE